MFRSLLKTAFRNIAHKFGHSFLNILGMTLGITSALFLILTTISFALSIPAVWFVMSDWLQDFVYRYEMGPLVFLWTIILILVLTVFTISYQSYKAAATNPADSMRVE